MTDALHTCAGEAAELPLSRDGSVPDWVELLPTGVTQARDGRVFRLTDAKGVIVRSTGAGQELPVDYEHQAERENTVGPVPAAGWIVELAERAGAIWGRVSWTPRAAQMLSEREYRFLSPAMMVAKDGTVQRILGAGLVHRPALSLKALAAEETPMTDTNATIVLDRQALAERMGTDAETLTTAAVLERLQATAQNSATPDPAAYVPIEAVKELLSSRAELQTALSESEADRRVTAAMEAGHITPAMQPWAKSLCSADPEAFDAFLTASPAPFKHLGDRITPSRTARPNTLNQGRDYEDATLAICAQMGMTPDQLGD